MFLLYIYAGRQVYPLVAEKMLSPLGQHERGGAAVVVVVVGTCLLGAGLLALGVWQETRIRLLGRASGPACVHIL